MKYIVNINEKPKPYFDIYIGRAGHGEIGEWGNPVIMHKKCPMCGLKHHTRGSTLPCYNQYLWNSVVKDPSLANKIRALRGKILGCFCKPDHCHGDVLLKVIEWLWSPEGLERFPQ